MKTLTWSVKVKREDVPQIKRVAEQFENCPAIFCTEYLADGLHFNLKWITYTEEQERDFTQFAGLCGWEVDYEVDCRVFLRSFDENGEVL